LFSPDPRLSNPQLQRTPLRAPLSHKPLGGGRFTEVRRLALTGSFFSLLALALGCRHGGAQQSEKLPAELLVPAGAREVSSRVEGGIAAVKFKINAAYPAADFLATTSSRLEPLGWRKLPTDWLNPTIPSSHIRGWTSFPNTRTRPFMGVHQWIGDWQNMSGDVVTYSLRYASPVQDTQHKVAPPTNDNLEVTEMLIPATMAKSMQDDAVQRSKSRAR
jgi:hypothetical protein